MQRIDLTGTHMHETVEIVLPSGAVRIQVNAVVGGLLSDVVQMDVNRAALQTVTGSSEFIRVVRRLKAMPPQQLTCSQPTKKKRQP